MESYGNRLENEASKKEKKVKKKQNVPSKKMKGVEADSILETDSNQNVFKVIPNVPVSNSFRILDEDNLQDETPPIISTLSNVLSACHQTPPKKSLHLQPQVCCPPHQMMLLMLEREVELLTI